MALGMFKRGEDVDGQIPELRHVPIAFGGLASLEQAFKIDAQLAAAGVTEPWQCFDFWVDTHHPHRVGEGVQSVGKSKGKGREGSLGGKSSPYLRASGGVESPSLGL